MVGIFQSPRPHREGAREGVGQLLTGRGGQLQAHIGGERNPDRVHQHLGHALLGDLHRGRALAEFLVKGLAAEQLQGEVHLALVIGEVVHPAERAQRIALLQPGRGLEAHEKILAGDHLGRGLADKRLHGDTARGQAPFAGAIGQGEPCRGLAFCIGDNHRQPLADPGHFTADGSIAASGLAVPLLITQIGGEVNAKFALIGVQVIPEKKHGFPLVRIKTVIGIDENRAKRRQLAIQLQLHPYIGECAP